MSIFNREKIGEGLVFFIVGVRKIMMEFDDNFVMCIFLFFLLVLWGFDWYFWVGFVV